MTIGEHRQYMIRSKFRPEALSQAGVRTVRRNFSGLRGFAFLAKDKARALAALGWPAEQVVALPTCEATTFWLKRLPQYQPQLTISVKHQQSLSEGDHQYVEALRSWLQQQANVLPFEVVIHVDWDCRRKPGEPGKLHIFVGSGDTTFTFKKRTVCGRQVDFQNANIWIGELALHEPGAPAIARQILDQHFRCITGEPWLILQSTLYEEQLRLISRLPYVQAVIGDHGVVTIYTRRAVLSLDAQQPARSLCRDLGEYKITLRPGDRGDGLLEVENVSRPGQIAHPHSLGGTAFCLGDAYSERVMPKVKQGDFVSALSDIWLVLQTVNGHELAPFPAFAT